MHSDARLVALGTAVHAGVGIISLFRKRCLKNFAEVWIKTAIQFYQLDKTKVIVFRVREAKT